MFAMMSIALHFKKKNAEGERIIECRFCKICTLYHSTIAAMKEHKQVCKRSDKRRTVESSVESDDKVGSDAEIESNQAKEDPEPEQSIINGNRNIFEQINHFFGL